jgi:endonuclease YncB( thermonuclease family)
MVLLAAALTGLLGVARIYAEGTDVIAVAMVAASLGLWVIVIWAALPDGALTALGKLSRLPAVPDRLRGLPAELARLPLSMQRIIAGAAVVVLVAVLGWLGSSIIGNSLPSLSVASLPGFASSAIEGRASAVTGDALRINGRTLRLAGIDAPEYQQTCGGRGKERRWRCGAVARTALQELVRNRTVRCEPSGHEAAGQEIAGCRIGDKDVAAELVTRGHVFAQTGLFASYGRLEAAARSAGLGVWRGASERPAEYRARLWEAAKKAAPSGCPIKGHVTRGERVYVVPWSPSYARTRVRESRGGRWFCDEREAVTAGWKSTDRS